MPTARIRSRFRLIMRLPRLVPAQQASDGASADTGSIDVPKSSALAEAEELVQQAADLRDRLQSERSEYAAKIRNIDAMLAKLPGQEAQKPHGAPSGPIHGQTNTKTIPGLLLAIIAASPGITSKDVIAAAQKKRSKLTPRDVFANLYRLHRVRHMIRAEGPKGSTRYFLTEPSEEASA